MQFAATLPVLDYMSGPEIYGLREKSIPFRVLHVINSAGWECSGIAKLALGFAQGADASLCSVDLLFLRPGPLLEQFRRSGISTHLLTTENQNGVLAFPILLHFLRKGSYDIVHLHNGGRLTQYAAKLSGASVVLQIHGLSESGGKGHRAFPVVFADEVVVVSEFVARAMGDRKVTVVHPGIEFPMSDSEPHRLRDIPVVGTLGRLVRVKGIAHLLGAFSQVLRELPEARLEIAGDGPELEALVQEGERLGITSSVSFLGWVQRPQEVLSRWSVYAQPSLEEAAGLGVLEASAAKLPVIASRVGGLPEMMQDGVSGYLVEPGDETGLAKALIKVLVSPEEAGTMGDAGSALVKSRFSLERMCSGVQAIYGRLLTSARSRRMKENTLIAS